MRTASWILAGALCVAALVGCGGERVAAPPNVVVITLDTVRSDHLGCYGYDRDTSPRIDALAATSTRYSRAMAASSWTVPTHASLFTGRFAFEHGAHAFEVPEGEVNNVNPLPEDAVTLAEVLSERGYTTGAFVANEAFLSQRWQINQGFETYEVARVYGDRLNDRAFRWLDAVAGAGRPFFMFVNYIDAHRPYNTRRPPRTVDWTATRDNGELLDALYDAVMPASEPVPRDLAQRVIDQYDMAIANVDAAVGELIDRLDRSGVLGNTVVVITSDHGEYFGEHHLVEHSKDIYQPGLVVPLIVRAPGQETGAVVDTLVASTDVPRLVLRPFPRDPEWDAARSQFPDVPGNHDVIAELYYTRTKDLHHPIWGERFDRIRTAVFDWPWKYIGSSAGGHELYHLGDDPHELKNLAGEQSDVRDRMIDRLEEFFASRMRSEGRVDQAPLTDEEIRRMKSLGYIGTDG